MATNSLTRVVVPCRISFANIWEPRGVNGSEPKYSVSCLISKEDKTTLAKINRAVEAAKEDGKTRKWAGKIPANLKMPLHDGDVDRPDDEAYEGVMYFNANSKDAPQVVDRRKQKVEDPMMVYSGCYCNVSVNFYAFSAGGNRGIAAGLMKLVESILTKNPCYKAGKKITVKGLMLHSVGCPQPKASVFINNWNRADYNSACVHGFIDGNDGTVYQTLPWNHRGWHAGGSANNTHIGVEMCEPACIKYTGGSSFTCSDRDAARTSVKKTYEAAVELFAMLCRQYGLDPLADGVIISHREGCARGVASNHADPEHLWNGLRMGYTMDGFRRDVNAAMGGAEKPVVDTGVQMSEKQLYDYFRSQGFNDYGVSGLLGNLKAESNCIANNLQSTYNKKLNITDEEYTRLVDGGNYPDFITDKAGYGLAQWTYWSRKAALLSFAQDKCKSIGDAGMQCEFLMYELKNSYPTVLSVLKEAKSVREASDAVLLYYEKPADQSEKVRVKRTEFGQAFYDRYAGAGSAGTTGTETTTVTTVPFLVRITAKDLRIRSGAGTDTNWTGKYVPPGVYTIVEVKSGKGSNSGWGRLKSGLGWVALDYAQRI